MNHGCVTLNEVLAAASIRAASLVPEIAGYLLLAIGDATSRLPFAVDDRVVMLTTEGNVGITKRGEMLSPHQGAANLRATLARLLAVSTGTAMPSLTAAARPREESDRGVEAVIEEIEAALIPVNRAAARRALARLARETIKVKGIGRLRRVAARAAQRPAPPPAPAAAPTAVAPPAPPPPPVVVAPRPPVVASAPPPVAPAPTPAPASAAELHNDVAAAALTPPPETREPTPTVLGMAPIEIDVEISPAPPAGAPVAETAASAPEPHAPAEAPAPEPATPAPSAAPTPTGLPESAVLAQPTEDPRLAFAIERRTEGDQGLTPPFSRDAAPPPRGLPATRPLPPPPAPAPAPAHVAPAPAPARMAPAPKRTRADDLLAHFGASCVDAESMQHTTACLRRMAGVDTPAPPARVEIRLPDAPRPAAQQGPAADASTFWTSDETRRLPRRRPLWSRTIVPLAMLVVGLAGGATMAWLRSERAGAAAPPAAATVEKTAEKKEAAPPPPATEPAGAATPLRVERLGGTRAERGSEQRAR